MTLRVAIFGGAFNPPHLGHAGVIRRVLEHGEADVVWVVPSANHPLKPKLPSFDWRCRLVRGMLQDVGDDRVSLSRVEERLPAPCYSLTLLDYLSNMHPDMTFKLVIGEDNLRIKNQWHGFDDLVARHGLIVVPRVEDDSVSSTEVRRRLDAGEDVRDLLTPTVYKLLVN